MGQSHPSPPLQAFHVTVMQTEDSERGRNMEREGGNPQTRPLLEEGLPWPEPQELPGRVRGGVSPGGGTSGCSDTAAPGCPGDSGVPSGGLLRHGGC